MKPGVMKVLFLVVLLILLVIAVGPFFWTLITSLTTEQNSVLWPPQIIPHPVEWSNYMQVFEQSPMGRYLLNSVIQAVCVVLGQLVTASLAGYALARIRFPGRNLLMFCILGVIMIPFEVTMIPLFVLVYKLGWLNTYYALIVPLLATPFGTFLLRQFFLSIPQSLLDAAMIDGCGHLRTLWRIVLPLSKPALATQSLFTFVAVWNSLLWPLLVIDQPSMRTVQVALIYFKGSEFTDFPLLMAAVVIATIPMLIVFLAAQKYFVKGFTLTGLKG